MLPKEQTRTQSL